MTADELSLIQRSKALRVTAKETEALPYSAEKTVRIVQEHHMFLRLSYLMEAEIEERQHKLEAAQHELTMLTEQVFKLVKTSMRSTTGFEWKKAFKENSQALEHFQTLHQIARYLRLKNSQLAS